MSQSSLFYRNGEHPKLILWSKTWSQKVNNCAQVKEEHQEEIKSVETPVAASASLKVEPDTAVVEESEVNLGTEVEIEAEEEVVSSEDKTQSEESVPAVEKSGKFSVGQRHPFILCD